MFSPDLSGASKLRSRTSISSANYKTGDHLTLKIEKIVPKGFGIAFAESLTVFVALSAPGDHLRVEITQLKKKIAFAEIVEIIEAGPNRVAPACKYFGACGGCDFQQMSYAAQLDAKADIIQDCLKRIGKIRIADEIKIIPSPREYNYRSRARWHALTDLRAIGYYKRNSHDVIDIEACPIVTPQLQSALDGLRRDLSWQDLWDGGTEIDAASGDNGTTSVYSPATNERTNEISFSTAADRYFYSARSFFQGNQFLIEKMVELAVGGASGETAVDLYCGVGLFTLPLARLFSNVIAIEENKLAIDYLRKNAESAQLDNIEGVQNSVAAALPQHAFGNIDLLLLDPPRSGTENGVIGSIIKLRPRQISYVSCEASILARDLRVLLDGGYEIESITGLDLFPQTHHVETIVRLRRA